MCSTTFRVTSWAIRNPNLLCQRKKIPFPRFLVCVIPPKLDAWIQYDISKSVLQVE